MNEYYLVADDPEQVELYAMILEVMRLQDTKVDNTIEDNQIISIGTDYKVKIIESRGGRLSQPQRLT